MNPFRTELVEKAFNKLDVNSTGAVDIALIKTRYDAQRHPEVRMGKKTTEDIMKEFFETFDMHHAVMHGY